jgi:hypothetical protein
MATCVSVGLYQLSFNAVDGRKKPIHFSSEIVAAVQPEDWIADDPLYINRALRNCVYGKADMDKFRGTKPIVKFIRIIQGH